VAREVGVRHYDQLVQNGKLASGQIYYAALIRSGLSDESTGILA
jgi:hypothetical protein